MKNKKGAMELSMSTMVVIALSIAILVIGMIFIRKIMCSGIVLTDKITKSAENQVKSLFNQGDEGVKCLGEGEEEVTLGGGGKRKIFCIIKDNNGGTYHFKNINIDKKYMGSTEITSTSSDKDVNRIKLIYNGNKEVDVLAGKEKIVAIGALIVPKDVHSEDSLSITLDVEHDGSSESKTLYLNFEPVGAFKSTIC